MSSFDLRRASKHFSMLAVAGFLIMPATARAQVPGKAAVAATKQAIKIDELATLKSAKKLLEEANHDYKGHRAKAVHAIHEAIRELEHHGQKVTGTHVPTTPAVAAAKAAAHASSAAKAASIPPVHEGQAISDTQLAAAQQLLLKVAAELSTTGKHPKASAHVQIAIEELQTAMKIL